MMQTKKCEAILGRLARSDFRSKFQLDEKDFEYISARGMDILKKHAQDFITRRIAPAIIKNDGKQTPMQGHPIFKAQHATGTCCRKCLNKWHDIKPDRKLTAKEIKYTSEIIMTWLEQQLDGSLVGQK